MQCEIDLLKLCACARPNVSGAVCACDHCEDIATLFCCEIPEQLCVTMAKSGTKLPKNASQRQPVKKPNDVATTKQGYAIYAVCKLTRQEHMQQMSVIASKFGRREIFPFSPVQGALHHWHVIAHSLKDGFVGQHDVTRMFMVFRLYCESSQS